MNAITLKLYQICDSSNFHIENVTAECEGTEHLLHSARTGIANARLSQCTLYMRDRKFKGSAKLTYNWCEYDGDRVEVRFLRQRMRFCSGKWRGYGLPRATSRPRTLHVRIERD